MSINKNLNHDISSFNEKCIEHFISQKKGGSILNIFDVKYNIKNNFYFKNKYNYLMITVYFLCIPKFTTIILY